MESESKGQLVQPSPVALFKPADQLPIMPMMLHENPAVYSTILPTTPEQKMELYDMMIEGGDNSKDWVNRKFTIRDLLVHPVVKTDPKTGEQTPLPRIVIMTTEGDRIQFASTGIWGSLLMMITCGISPFGPLVQEFQLVAQPLGDNKSVYKLIRVKPILSKGAKK